MASVPKPCSLLTAVTEVAEEIFGRFAKFCINFRSYHRVATKFSVADFFNFIFYLRNFLRNLKYVVLFRIFKKNEKLLEIMKFRHK